MKMRVIGEMQMQSLAMAREYFVKSGEFNAYSLWVFELLYFESLIYRCLCVFFVCFVVLLFDLFVYQI